MNKNKSQNNNIKPQSPIDRSWVKRVQENAQANLAKKYPEKFSVQPEKPIESN